MDRFYWFTFLQLELKLNEKLSDGFERLPRFIQEYCHQRQNLIDDWPKDHTLSTYAKFPEKLTFFTYVCVSRGKKCYFSENFAYVLNEWSHSIS